MVRADLPFKEPDMTRVLLSVGTIAGLPTSNWCRVIAAPHSVPLHSGSTAAPGAPAAPVTIHLLCVCAQLGKNTVNVREDIII